MNVLAELPPFLLVGIIVSAGKKLDFQSSGTHFDPSSAALVKSETQQKD